LAHRWLRTVSPADPKESPVTDSVRWDLDEAVATITLNRPEARNALTSELGH